MFDDIMQRLLDYKEEILSDDLRFTARQKAE